MNKKVDIKFSIPIKNSTALEKFEYNSETGIINVTYTSGKTYSYVGPNVYDVLFFVAKAVDEDSWGRSWNQWSRRMDLKRAEEFTNGTKSLFANMSLPELEVARRELEETKARLEKEAASGAPRRDFYGTRGWR